MKPFSFKDLKRWLPSRSPDSHKGDFGHVLVVAGSRGMTGAAVLAARGALRAGCGLATVALPESQQPIAACQLAEAMTLPLPETSNGALRADAVGRLQASHQNRGYTVLALGPGIGTHAETARAVVGLLGSLGIPAVVDADALNLLALQTRSAVRTLLDRRGAPFILTPHPGEIGRLLRMDAATVQRDREAAARLLVHEFGGVCVLKGRHTLITDGDRVWFNPTGNPGLAKGGSGDALTGVIAGLWAQRLRTGSGGSDKGFEAAALGAYLHGLAADLAEKEKTARAMLANDVVEALPEAFKKLGG
jgi:NAD(P)H-hydrate epimerase